MAKKTYRTYHLKGLQVLLFDDYGRPLEVNFRGGCQIDSTSKFTTSDENVQKALESCSGFGRDFYIESVREDAPVVNENEDVVEEEAVTENLLKVEVADKAEAIEWLKEHHAEKGYTAAKLRTKSAFEEACAECGVVFEITD